MFGTKIQWCDDTTNPVMGCDGCELWPSFNTVTHKVTGIVVKHSEKPRDMVLLAMEEIAENTRLLRKELIKQATELIGDRILRRQAYLEMKAVTKCYAGILGENRGSKIKGYARVFDHPETFPGRMELAARQKSLKGLLREDKLWIGELPRLIFISDMGDALSGNIMFPYLRGEIIKNVNSEDGRRHIWLWLTKRPGRMAEFARYLKDQGIPWPVNLVAMTTVTSQQTVGRTEQLLEVPAPCRALSIEPLFGPVKLGSLDGIDWLIVGGESGTGAGPCDIQWVLDIREQCRRAEVAFFVKQLGAKPTENGKPLVLKDQHGGNWNEWPHDLKIREFPAGFHGIA